MQLKSDGTAAVADFGLAKFMPEDIAIEDENAFGAAKWLFELLVSLMKFRMPPEFANRVISVKTDTFSFAVTLWEIVTRSDPWPGLTPSILSSFSLIFAGVALQQVREGQRLPIPECPSVIKALIDE